MPCSVFDYSVHWHCVHVVPSSVHATGLDGTDGRCGSHAPSKTTAGWSATIQGFF